ncbi:lysin B [Gordonia phage LilyPad]|nr:lysin B [Gordonia phage LilyPad]
MREIILVGGAGEGARRATDQFLYGYLRPFLKPTDRISPIYYPASIGVANNTPQPDLREGAYESRQVAKKRLADHIRSTPHVPYIAAYSLGAWAVAEFLEEMAQGKYPGLEIAGVILVASPLNGKDSGWGYGIVRKHKRFPNNFPIAEVNNWNDGICCCPEGSALRVLPLLGEIFTINQGKPEIRRKVLEFVSAAFATAKVLPTRHDLMLLANYADGRAHGSDYRSDVLRAPAKRMLG